VRYAVALVARATRRGGAAGCRSVFLFLLLLACGGESRRRQPAIVSDAGAPNAATDAGADANPVPRPKPASCPTLTLPIDATSLAVTEVDGVVIEPLQLPDYPAEPAPSCPGCGPSGDPDPSTWDRSELPANACVFRLHGVSAACYPLGGTIYTDSCETWPKVAPGTFYEHYACSGVVPGCPTPEPYNHALGYWWYLVDRGDAADLVICAPECAGSFKHGPACAVLDPARSVTCD
jgi:hypothetical protein